jgi:hypothetical protein
VISGHHPRIDTRSESDLRNGAAYRQWLSRLASRFNAVDARTGHQLAQATDHYASAVIKARMYLAYRAARIRNEVKQAARRGLRVINGGRC